MALSLVVADCENKSNDQQHNLITLVFSKITSFACLFSEILGSSQGSEGAEGKGERGWSTRPISLFRETLEATGKAHFIVFVELGPALWRVQFLGPQLVER